jgi:hypothetical protein
MVADQSAKFIAIARFMRLDALDVEVRRLGDR